MKLLITLITSFLFCTLYTFAQVDQLEIEGVFGQDLDLIYADNTGWDNTSEFQISEDSELSIAVYNHEVAPYKCNCLISYKNLTGKKHSQGACKYLDTKHTERFPINDFKRRRCNEKCTNVAKRMSNSQKKALESCICKGATKSTEINAYSHLGANKRMTAHGIGSVVVKPATYRTVCDCPNGWDYDKTNNKCKKALCKTASPTGNQGLGNWGFIWNNVIYEWKKASCKQVLAQANSCKFVVN